MIRRLILACSTAMAVLAGGALIALTPSPASAASLVQINDFGNNPSDLEMYLYVPDNVQPQPPILVAAHYCTGTGPAFYSGTEFASLADQYGFIVIYPSVTRGSACFDVYTQEALHRDGGSDPVGIMSMVNYVKQNYNGDPERVYATGSSSGAMMTNVLLADYPDVFDAGAAFSGVPATCFATTPPNEWNSDCANGNVIKSPQEWGDAVRAAYPGYTGPRPRMQLWHGTADTTLAYPNFGEQIKQWTNVHGLGQTPTYTDNPHSGWTRTRYGGSGPQAPVEAISLQGVGHDTLTTGMAARAIEFFGLDDGQPPTTSPPTTPPGSADCGVTYQQNAWSTGLVAGITIVNTGDTPIDGWSLTFTLPPGQAITSGWNATYTPTSGDVTATNVNYNTTIDSGASLSIGFQATHTGNTDPPSTFTLNGTACATG